MWLLVYILLDAWPVSCALCIPGAMTVLYSFCFWFSVRLGSIIVGLSCLVQCVLALIACGIGLDNLVRTSKDIDYWLKTNDLLIAKVFFTSMRDDPEYYLTWFTSVLTVYLCACILLIYASFKCNLYLMYPFILLDFIRLVLMTALLIVILLLVKRNTLDLGLIIGASVGGVFIMLYLWYQWFCTVSLVQIIREIEKMDKGNKEFQQTPGPSNMYRKKQFDYTSHFRGAMLK